MDRALTAEQNANGPALIECFGQRQLKGAARRIMQSAAVALPVITIAVAFTGWFDPMTRRAGHLLFAIPLGFLLYPLRRGRDDRLSVADWALAAGAVDAFGWIVMERERILWRFVYVDPLTWVDVVLGSLAILLVLEATRRTLGWTIVVVTGLFLAYAFAGPYLPWILGHKGVSPSLLIEHLY